MPSRPSRRRARATQRPWPRASSSPSFLSVLVRHLYEATLRLSLSRVNMACTGKGSSRQCPHGDAAAPEAAERGDRAADDPLGLPHLPRADLAPGGDLEAD